MLNHNKHTVRSRCFEHCIESTIHHERLLVVPLTILTYRTCRNGSRASTFESIRRK